MNATTARVLAMIGGVVVAGASFLEWIDLGIGFGLTRTGFDLALDVYVNWDEVGLANSPFISAGLVTVLLGTLGVLGGATGRRALVRISGILGVLAVGLLFGNLFATNDMKIGYWILAGGAILTTLAGFIRTGEASA